MLFGSPFLWLLPLLLFSSRVVSEGAAGKRNRFPEEKKKSTSSQTRRGALCLLCNPKRRAAGAEWLLLVFIGAY